MDIKAIKRKLNQLLRETTSDTIYLASDDVEMPYTEDGVTIYIPTNIDSYSHLAAVSYRDGIHIKHLDLTNLNFKTDMRCMFQYWNNLETVTIGKHEVQNCVCLQGMFDGCVKLKTIDLSGIKAPMLKSYRAISSDFEKLVLPRVERIDGQPIHIKQKEVDLTHVGTITSELYDYIDKDNYSLHPHKKLEMTITIAEETFDKMKESQYKYLNDSVSIVVV